MLMKPETLFKIIRGIFFRRIITSFSNILSRYLNWCTFSSWINEGNVRFTRNDTQFTWKISALWSPSMLLLRNRDHHLTHWMSFQLSKSDCVLLYELQRDICVPAHRGEIEIWEYCTWNTFFLVRSQQQRMKTFFKYFWDAHWDREMLEYASPYLFDLQNVNSLPFFLSSDEKDYIEEHVSRLQFHECDFDNDKTDTKTCLIFQISSAARYRPTKTNIENGCLSFQ